MHRNSKARSLTSARLKEVKNRYAIVRTLSAGAWAGYLRDREAHEVTLTSARRLYYWSGAASLSELAMAGVSRPGECRFPCEVDEVLLLEAIEVIPCRESARLSIASVPVWSAGTGDGSGSGDGYGGSDGSGDGAGDGSGSGDGAGYGDGSGDGSGSGDGAGTGEG